MDNKQKVYALVEPTYEYDDERYYESGEAVTQLYAKKEDAEHVIQSHMLIDMRNSGVVAEAIKTRFYDEAIKPETCESLKAILGENAIRFTKHDGFFVIRGFDWDELETAHLGEEDAKRLASLIGYDCHYAIKEMEVR